MIKYKDLSSWLKLAVIISWIVGGLWTIGFILGFLGLW